MSEYRIHQSINLSEMADEYAKRLQEQVDEIALDKAADVLARYGYVKVVRCRDCKHHHEGMCMLTDGMGDFKRWLVDDDDYCSDGEMAVGV